MRWNLLALIALTTASPAAAQTPTVDANGWRTTTSSSPLTGVKTSVAALDSSNELANMIGSAVRASLIVRCGEGGLAVFVKWPQVVSYDSTNFVGQPKTLAVWRIDDGKVQANYWDIDTTGTAAGEFKGKNALKLLSSLAGAMKLVVNRTGFAGGYSV